MNFEIQILAVFLTELVVTGLVKTEFIEIQKSAAALIFTVILVSEVKFVC